MEDANPSNTAETGGVEPPKGGLVATPAAALDEVKDYYRKWTAQLTQRSFELSMAVIAANWAVFGNLDGILKNQPAKWSITVVLIALFTILFGTWRMGELLRNRLNYAEKDPVRWAKEFENTKGKIDPWPYGVAIDSWGSRLRLVKTFGPIVAGALFILALFLR